MRSFLLHLLWQLSTSCWYFLNSLCHRLNKVLWKHSSEIPIHIGTMTSTTCMLQQKSFFQSSDVQFFWAHVNGSIGFLFLVHRSGSLYGLLLLFVFRDALLHNLIIMSGYFSYCWPPISWKQSGHFLFFRLFCRDGYLGKSCTFSSGPPDHYYMPKFIEMLPCDWMIGFYTFIEEAGKCNNIILLLYTLIYW